MSALVLSLDNIHLTFGGDPLFEGADIMVQPEARIALVGRNGSGKSTLLKIAAGLLPFDEGKRFISPRHTVRYLAQEPDAAGFETVLDFVRSGLGEHDDHFMCDALLAETGVDPSAKPTALSGGEFRKAALVQVLAAKPDILLLDEPTNHLDIPAIEWLEEKLRSSRSAVIVISHDRRFLSNVTTQTVWIDRGQTRALDRGFAHFEDWRDKVLEEEELAHHKLGRKIVAEEHWLRYGVTARRKRNVKRLADLHSLRKEHKEARGPQGKVQFTIGDQRQSGKRVIVAEAIAKSYGARALINDFSVEINRGDRIGIVGPNGVGKSTLVRILIGELEPDSGTVTLGANLDIVSLDQRRAALKPEMSLADAITDGRGDWVSFGEEKRHVATYLKDFLFGPEQWQSPISALSGGERGRLALAAAMARPSNLLVLDEPTNDLDLETLELLEEMLADFKGTLILVSHDRSFVDNLVTSVITNDPSVPAVWQRYAGGYDDMLAQRRASAPKPEAPKDRKPATGAASEKPKTGKSQKLSYKENYALENLPGEIDALHKTISALQTKLDDQALFSRNPEEFNRAVKDLEAAQGRLETAEEEWLELEMKREALAE